MSLDDIRLREEIDLAERAVEIREDLIPDLEERIEHAEDLAEDLADDEDADDPDQSADELRTFRDRLEGQAKACDRVVDAIGDGGECVFVVQELMGAETALVQDDVTEQSIDVDYEREEVEGLPKQGYQKIRLLEVAIVEWPDGAGAAATQRDRELGRDVFRVGKLPDHVVDYLFRVVETLNDLGEVEGVGNLSDYGVTISPP